MPHLHNDNTWVVFEWELVPRFYNSLNHLKVEIHRYKRRADGIKKIQSGGNGRQMLISFDSLRVDIKEAMGDPRKADNVLERFYTIDPDAALFFTQYELPDGTALNTTQQNEYTVNASVLQACITLCRERSAIHGTDRGLMSSVLADAVHFKSTMKAKYNMSHTLPESQKRFTEYLKSFQTAFEYRGRKYDVNYASIIPGNLRNQNAAKIIEGDLSLDILQSILENHNQFDDVYIRVAYNKKAREIGLKPVSTSTIGLWRRKLNAELKPFREGWDEFRNSHSRSVKRGRPSQPFFLWESDDNHIDLLFNGDDRSPYHRFKGIYVTDSYNDLVLGYCCTEGQLDPSHVKLAYINAMYYIRSITGGWYLPFEVKTDRWRLANLRPFYSRIGHYYDTPALSKNRGWLENFFGTEDWKRCLKMDADGTPAINYTGNNITARNAGFNREMSRINAKMFPTVQDAPNQIQTFVNRLRKINMHGDGSREMKWLEAFTRLPEERKRPINDAEFLTIFGFRHDWQNTIEKTGITATLLGRKVSYAVPPAYYLMNVGKKVDVYYDPYDLSRVLVTDNERLRFIAHEMTPVPGTMMDMQLAGEGSRSFLNQILDEKRADVDTIVQKREQRIKRLEAAGIDPEYVLAQGGHVAKEISQAAEMAYISNGYNDSDDFDPADLM